MKPKTTFSKFIAPLLALLFCIHLFTFTARVPNAVIPQNTLQTAATTATIASLPAAGTTSDLLVKALSNHLHIPPDLDTLVNLGYITSADRSFLQTSKTITMGMAWRILLPAYGIYPYPPELYSDLDLLHNKDCHNPDNEAYAAAVLSGLAHVGREFPSWIMSQESLKALIEQLESGNYIPLEPPFSLPDFACNITRDRQSFQYLNSAMRAACYIPRSWLVQFQADGWQIICQWQPESKISQHAKYFQEMEENGYTGLAVFTSKTIYLIEYDFRTLTHELTHYAAYKVGWTSAKLKPCYEAEASKIAKLLSTYSQTAPEEYFAEFVAYWFKYSERCESLTTDAPQTTALLHQLLKDFEALSNR